MQLPLSWLKEFLPLDNVSAETIANTLTLAGLEVDKLESIGPKFDQVIVAKVLHTEQHPDAERLRIATVDDGQERVQIVCGAPNCRAGIHVAMVRVGGTLYDEQGAAFKIKKSKLRGVESYGMLCSEKELGISQEDAGIVELPQEWALGSDLKNYYGDTIFHISLTCNINHANSVLGVARELAAFLNLPLKTHPLLVEENGTSSIEKLVNVEIHPSSPRYACRLLEGVRTGPSPQWLKERIERSGMRSVNNVVDITNYVMLELGQPLHAFDADKIQGTLRVTMADEGTPFTTLDDKERLLKAHNLVICDDCGPLAIAGVMGGKKSEVGLHTHRVLLESAYFLAETIRKSSKEIGISSEASKRFERNSDPGAVIKALQRASMLLQEVCGAKVVPGILDLHGRSFQAKTIACRIERIRTLIGGNFSYSEVEELLARLQCQVTFESDSLFHVRVPTWRTDLNSEIDIVEEVARLWGYDKIQRPLPLYHGSPLPHDPLSVFEKLVRQQMLRMNLQELLCCDLIGPYELSWLKGTNTPLEPIHLKNANVEEHSILRPSLFFGLLQAAKHNIRQQNDRLAGFEIGHIYQNEAGKAREHSALGVILMGDRHLGEWNHPAVPFDFFDLKALMERLIEQLNCTVSLSHHAPVAFLHPGQQMQLCIKQQVIGVFGKVHPKISHTIDVDKPLFFAQINLEALLKAQRATVAMEPLPQYPGSGRDITLTLPCACPAEKVLQWIKKYKASTLAEYNISALFSSEKLGENVKNLTIRCVYRHENKTLSYDEVQAAHLPLAEKLTQLAQGEQL